MNYLRGLNKFKRIQSHRKPSEAWIMLVLTQVLSRRTRVPYHLSPIREQCV